MIGENIITLQVTDGSGLSGNSKINIIIPEIITNSIGMTFVLIPAGDFIMGSPENEIGRDEDESQHKVTISKSFYMQTTEVTQGQWKAVMEGNPSLFSNCGDDCPVEMVSWEDCQLFISKLNAMENHNLYRLPTEAEWEYSARAGTTTALPNGDITVTDCNYDSNLDKIGWYCYNSGSKTHPVAQKQANLWGLYDMHGNVWEWCSDWYDSYPSTVVIDPTGASTGPSRVIRGGDWNDDALYCRSAYRGYDSPSPRISSIGTRLVRIP
ncbi:MAG: formylglycine-generating enzyme family protein [Desulfobacterales bacterium]|nr:formylglycine-generating enzyme family protein [Desulfobacterales bacterium]